MINKISGAKRLTGFDKPTVWSIMTPLAVKTKSINLVFISLFRVKASHHGLHQIFIWKILKKQKNSVIIYLMKQFINTQGPLDHFHL